MLGKKSKKKKKQKPAHLRKKRKRRRSGPSSSSSVDTRGGSAKRKRSKVEDVVQRTQRGEIEYLEKELERLDEVELSGQTMDFWLPLREDLLTEESVRPTQILPDEPDAQNVAESGQNGQNQQNPKTAEIDLNECLSLDLALSPATISAREASPTPTTPKKPTKMTLLCKIKETKFDKFDLNIDTKMDLVCVVDVSGSMSGGKLTAVKQTLVSLVTSMPEGHRIAIILFSNRATVFLNFKLITDTSRSQIIDLIAQIRVESMTNIVAGVLLAQMLLRARKTANNINSIWLLSDGEHNFGEISRDVLYRGDLRRAACFYNLSCFGYGGGHDSKTLQMMSESKNGNYYYVEKVGDVEECFLDCFDQVSSALGKNMVLRVDLRKLENLGVSGGDEDFEVVGGVAGGGGGLMEVADEDGGAENGRNGKNGEFSGFRFEKVFGSNWVLRDEFTAEATFNIFYAGFEKNLVAEIRFEGDFPENEVLANFDDSGAIEMTLGAAEVRVEALDNGTGADSQEGMKKLIEEFNAQKLDKNENSMAQEGTGGLGAPQNSQKTPQNGGKAANQEIEEDREFWEMVQKFKNLSLSEPKEDTSEPKNQLTVIKKALKVLKIPKTANPENPEIRSKIESIYPRPLQNEVKKHCLRLESIEVIGFAAKLLKSDMADSALKMVSLMKDKIKLVSKDLFGGQDEVLDGLIASLIGFEASARIGEFSENLADLGELGDTRVQNLDHFVQQTKHMHLNEAPAPLFSENLYRNKKQKKRKKKSGK